MMNVKCVVVGDDTVGKTSLLLTYSTDCYPGEFVPSCAQVGSVGVSVMLDGHQPVELQLVDTTGSEDGEADRQRLLCYPKTDVFLICFSIISPHSFDNVKSKWWPEIQCHAPGVPLILVGTKGDLRNDSAIAAHLAAKGLEVVSAAAAAERATEIGAAAYLECSALNQEGLKNVFDEAIRNSLTSRNKRNNTQKRSKSRCTIL